jgi:hypothetical protein
MYAPAHSPPIVPEEFTVGGVVLNWNENGGVPPITLTVAEPLHCPVHATEEVVTWMVIGGGEFTEAVNVF